LQNLTANLEVLFGNLTIVLDNVDRDIGLIEELGDILGARVPSHDGAAVLKRLDEGNSPGWSHGKLLAVWGEFVTPLLVDGLP
jgi:hypothetical protein